MPLLKPNSKNEIKRGEQKLKSIIGGKLIRNADFIRYSTSSFTSAYPADLLNKPILSLLILV